MGSHTLRRRVKRRPCLMAVRGGWEVPLSSPVSSGGAVAETSSTETPSAGGGETLKVDQQGSHLLIVVNPQLRRKDLNLSGLL